MTSDELRQHLPATPEEVVIRHDLSTSQKFHFDVIRVEHQDGRTILVTNGHVREDLK